MVRFDKPCVSVTHALNYFKMHMAGDDYLTEHGQAEMSGVVTMLHAWPAWNRAEG